MTVLYNAYELIYKLEKNAYSNIVLANFKNSSLSEKDKRFITRLFYGVIERRLTLESVVQKYVSKPINKLDIEVKITLMLGVYQLLYVDSINDSTAVNESVKLIKELKKTSASGMVNAVLRSFIRDNKAIPNIAELSVKYSCPKELIDRISLGYGKEKCESLLEASLKPSKTILRVNTTKIATDSLASILAEKGVKVEKIPFLQNALYVEGLRGIDSEENYLLGYYHAQDISSQLCAMAVNPNENDVVIDTCSAPGGKTFTMSQLMNNSGMIYACELHEKRAKLVESGAMRLGLSNITTRVGDARRIEGLPLADKVLCDVPCSGYGVIRNKPEIKYKPLSDSDNLPALQLDILTSASKWVKSGGLIVYSTCTVNKKENEDVVNAFLKQNSDFYGESFSDEMARIDDCFKDSFMTAVFPTSFDCDGFFISRLRRR